MAQYWKDEKQNDAVVAEAYFARKEVIDEIMAFSHKRFKQGKKMLTRGIYARCGKTPVTIYEPTTGQTVDMYSCSIVWRYHAYFGENGAYTKYGNYEV